MSRSAGPGQVRPLPFLHAAAMLALAFAWASFCWGENRPTVDARHVHPRDVLAVHQVLDILTAALGDLVLGLSALALFALGTGIYVRRLQVWIDARSSGEAVAYGSADLKDQALAANVTQREEL
jgi:hypothetical protein